MVKKWLSIGKAALAEVREFLDERGIGRANRELSRLYRFCHFWLRVAKSFSQNRCPVRASGLAYTTLLAAIPTLVVALSVSTGILKQGGEEQINGMVERLVSNFAPAAPANLTNGVGLSPANPEPGPTLESTNQLALNTGTNTTNMDLDVRGKAVELIKKFVQNSNSGTLGLTGMLFLIVAAISMLGRVEETFNDIWGAVRGRNWFVRIVQYWAVITLGPVLIVVLLGLTKGKYALQLQAFLASIPLLGAFTFKLLPIVVLCVAFAVFYVAMPNTKVHWDAALAGGFVAGTLWHLNNVFSFIYVSQLVTNGVVYGGLAMIPVFMIGLYFSWLIVLFGAQVAYAFQNRAEYLQLKQCENVNHRGREFIALRLMTHLAQRFVGGVRPATVHELSESLAVPTALVQQVLRILIAAELIIEVAGREGAAFVPSRPVETITCHDILQALRAGQGEELATSDEPARAEVYGEFQLIMEAEKRAATSVTLLNMVTRIETLALEAGKTIKAVENG